MTRQAPGFVASGRPQIAQGTQVGDVTPDKALIWARADRPARLRLRYAYDEKMTNAVMVSGPSALAPEDFTARVDLHRLRPGQQIFYEAWFEDLGDLKTTSPVAKGRFRTPGASKPLRIQWSGDTAGQGYGINPDDGGYRIFSAMAARDPDAFVHCGDMVYADSPIPPEVKIPGGVWRNVTTEATSKVAETLDEFRGRYLYNLMDEHLRRYNAEVPQIVTWDDHEITNDWHPVPETWRPQHYKRVRSMQLLLARGRRAMMEFTPIRPQPAAPERLHRMVRMGPLADVCVLDNRRFRSVSNHGRQTRRGADTHWLGEAQRQWLVRSLSRSTATWKIVAVGGPLSLVIRHGPQAFEGVANADHGPPMGRELEIAALLSDLKKANVKNVVWVTADVHYAAAHHYDPSRAKVTDFDPFWEFVAGPLHAGTFGPNALDGTFGPEVRFQKTAGPVLNLPPSMGLQSFGELEIDPVSEEMKVTLLDRAGERLWSVVLPPAA